MSDRLSAAAAALGIPESLVQRSAAARAAETGSSADEILAAWAGGEAAPAPAPEAEDVPEPATADEPTAAEPAAQPSTPEIVIETPPARAEPPVPVAAGPYKPPVLVGVKDNPMIILAAAVGLFAVIFLVGFVGASFQGEAPGARSSEIAYSAQALDGRAVYRSLNCGSCHTQMVRPVIADVGLGGVTVHDTNQVIGTRRFGPDLSNVGTRLTASQLDAVVAGLGEHPAFSLSAEDVSALVAYLAESQTAEATGG